MTHLKDRITQHADRSEPLLQQTASIDSTAASDKELSKYRATVELCASLKLDAALPNGYAEHAAILFSAFFRHAEREVRIYSGQLYGGVFDSEEDVSKEAIKFLRKDKDCRLQIAISEDINPSEFMKKPFIAKILSEPDIKNKLSISNVFGKSSGNHFAVMDQTAYRYETSHQKKQAVANFGDPAQAEELYNKFESIVKQAPLMFPQSAPPCS